jgi:hypothetical protein
MNRFQGFDTARYQGDKVMQAWKTASPYRYAGYYLKAPCHSDATYMGTRARLAAMGWGFLIVYVGRQIEGPCSNRAVSAGLGAAPRPRRSRQNRRRRFSGPLRHLP